MIHRFCEDPSTALDPIGFNLLLLGQNFQDPVDLSRAAHKAWYSLQRFGPFATQRNNRHRLIYPFYDDGHPPVDNLGVHQTGRTLSLDPSKLDAYLAKQQVTIGKRNLNATEVFGAQYGLGGRIGSLIAVLVSGSQPGELYELNSAAYPVPVVGIVVAGDWWPAVIARAVAQVLVGLGDEYEVTDPALAQQFDKPPPGSVFQAANLFAVTDAERASLVAGDPPLTILPDLTRSWPLASSSALTFHANPRQQGDPMTLGKVTDKIELVEGGGGFRLNVLRANWDCLMRRVPYDGNLPVQADVGFCRVCSQRLLMAAHGLPEVQYDRRITLGTQQLRFDQVSWPGPLSTQTLHGPLSIGTVTHGTPGTTKPRWSCDVTVDDQTGLNITNLKLFDRPDDPLSSEENVIEKIRFGDLSITFENSSPARLKISDAFSPPKGVQAPELAIAKDGDSDPKCNIGIKLILNWRLGGWDIEAVMSLVLRGMKNDIDPAGVVQACKIYPQMSIRCRRPKGATGELPKIAATHGAIEWTCNNNPPAMAGRPIGPLAVGIFADSNTAKSDDKFQTSAASLFSVPMFGNVPFLAYTWKSGRKVARVEPKGGGTTLAATARLSYVKGITPIVTFWSWLFDYAIPHCSDEGITTKEFTAVYNTAETTNSGASASTTRTRKEAYPPPGSDGTTRDYEMTVVKMPRQGAFDNVHVSADMGIDSEGRIVAQAPFCADKCLHLHWRWGAVAAEVASNVFRGWGPGRRELGPHTVLGAPLIPPNQHLKVKVDQPPPGDKVTVRYDVSASGPGVDEPQVMLEQGISFAFNYDGNLPSGYFNGVKGLAATVGAPAGATLRDIYASIYPKLRFFDTTVDGMDLQQVPGPMWANFSALEDL